MSSKTKTGLLFYSLLCFLISEAQNTISHDHYWSVRPLSWITANPNFQFGNRLPTRDSTKRLYHEMSFTYPFGKIYMEELSVLDNKIVALLVENRLRYVNSRNTFIGPVFELDYRRYSYDRWNLVSSGPEYNFLNIRLGFEHGKFFPKNKRAVSAIYWGLALRYSLDLVDSHKMNGLGSKDYFYWGLKLYLNWQIGQGYKAVYPRKY